MDTNQMKLLAVVILQRRLQARRRRRNWIHEIKQVRTQMGETSRLPVGISEEDAKKKCRNLRDRDRHRKDGPPAAEQQSPAVSDAEDPTCSPATEPTMVLTPGPAEPSEGPCTATAAPRGRSRPSGGPRIGQTELSEFEAEVMSSLGSRPDEEYYFGLSLAATMRRLPSLKRRLLRCCIEQLVFEVEFGGSRHNI